MDAALGAPGSPIQQTVRDVDAGLREPFERFDLVLLLNVPAPSREDAAQLAAFVEAGGGLFISMGDQVDPDAYNRALGALLPRPLRLVKTAAARDEPGGEDRAVRQGPALELLDLRDRPAEGRRSQATGRGRKPWRDNRRSGRVDRRRAGPYGKVEIPDGARRIEANGRVLLPGL